MDSPWRRGSGKLTTTGTTTASQDSWSVANAQVASIQRTLRSLAHHINKIMRLVSYLGTWRDNSEVRKQLTAERAAASATARHLQSLLALQPPPREATPNVKVALGKLFSDYEQLCARLRQVCEDSIQKEHDMRLSQVISSHTTSDSDDRSPETFLRLEGDHLDANSVHLVALPPLTDSALVQERNEAMLELERNLKALSGTFATFGEQVEEQQEPLHTAQHNIASATAHTDDAIGELAQASRYKSLYLPVAGALVGGLLMGPIGFVVGLKGGVLAATVAGGAVGGGVTGATLAHHHRHTLDDEVHRDRATSASELKALMSPPPGSLHNLRGRHARGNSSE